MSHDANPYSPPNAADLRIASEPEDLLRQIQKYFRRIAYLLLGYLAICDGVIVTQIVIWRTIPLAGLLFPMVYSVLFIWAGIIMIRIGLATETEFLKHYRKARWLMILVGAIFFPILAIPAYITVGRMTRYIRLRD